MAASSQSFARHAEYKGPKAIFSGEEVGYVLAFYALTKDGKGLLERNGKPVRLMAVDQAPDDPGDGRTKFLVASEKDPPTTDKGRLVELEPESVHIKTRTGA